MARKSVAERLRQGLQREDQALDARFAVADSAMAYLKTAARTMESQSPVPPASAKLPSNISKRTTSEPTRPAAAGLVVRESFSMPLEDRDTLNQLIDVLRRRGRYEITRSQLLRAGIASLATLNPAELERAVAEVQRGRPGRKVNQQDVTLNANIVKGNA
jgi:hypothetical protein